MLLEGKKFAGHNSEDGVASYFELGDEIETKGYNGDTAALEQEFGHRISQTFGTERCQDTVEVHPGAKVDIDGNPYARDVVMNTEHTVASVRSDQHGNFTASFTGKRKALDCDDTISALMEAAIPNAMPKTPKVLDGHTPYAHGSSVVEKVGSVIKADLSVVILNMSIAVVGCIVMPDAIALLVNVLGRITIVISGDIVKVIAIANGNIAIAIGKSVIEFGKFAITIVIVGGKNAIAFAIAIVRFRYLLLFVLTVAFVDGEFYLLDCCIYPPQEIVTSVENKITETEFDTNIDVEQQFDARSSSKGSDIEAISFNSNLVDSFTESANAASTAKSKAASLEEEMPYVIVAPSVHSQETQLISRNKSWKVGNLSGRTSVTAKGRVEGLGSDLKLPILLLLTNSTIWCRLLIGRFVIGVLGSYVILMYGLMCQLVVNYLVILIMRVYGCLFVKLRVIIFLIVLLYLLDGYICLLVWKLCLGIRRNLKVDLNVKVIGYGLIGELICLVG